MPNLHDVREFLCAQSTLSLATFDACGNPRCTPLFYWMDEALDLFWFSSVSSDHSRDLARQPAAALSIYGQTEDWKQIRGVQMRGRAEQIADPELRRRVETAYAERFRLSAFLRLALRRSALYRFQPKWVRYVDNSVRFGFKREFQISRDVRASTESKPLPICPGSIFFSLNGHHRKQQQNKNHRS